MIYEWSQPESGVDLVGVDEADERRLLWYDTVLGDPLPELADWVAPTIKRSNLRNRSKPIGDAPMSRIVNLISARAARCMSSVFASHAILYPLVSDDNTEPDYFMVRATRVIDCLDRKKSTGPLQKVGPTPELFAYVEEWSFDEDRLGDTLMFRLPDSETTIYVTEAFKALVVEHKLSGFCLKKSFWDTLPWISAKRP